MGAKDLLERRLPDPLVLLFSSQPSRSLKNPPSPNEVPAAIYGKSFSRIPFRLARREDRTAQYVSNDRTLLAELVEDAWELKLESNQVAFLASGEAFQPRDSRSGVLPESLIVVETEERRFSLAP